MFCVEWIVGFFVVVVVNLVGYFIGIMTRGGIDGEI